MSYWQDKELKRRTKENQSGAILVFYSALSTEFLMAPGKISCELTGSPSLNKVFFN